MWLKKILARIIEKRESKREAEAVRGLAQEMGVEPAYFEVLAKLVKEKKIKVGIFVQE